MNKNHVPPFIEKMVESLNDPNTSKFLKNSHLKLIENSIAALSKAAEDYKNKQKAAKK